MEHLYKEKLDELDEIAKNTHFRLYKTMQGIMDKFIFQEMGYLEKGLTFPPGMSKDPEGKEILYLTAKEEMASKIKILTPFEYFNLINDGKEIPNALTLPLLKSLMQNVERSPATYVIDINKLTKNPSRDSSFNLEKVCEEEIKNNIQKIQYELPEWEDFKDNFEDYSIAFANNEQRILKNLRQTLNNPSNGVYAGVTFEGTLWETLREILTIEEKEKLETEQKARELQKQNTPIRKFWHSLFAH